MLIYNLLGEEIFVCSKIEAQNLWTKDKAARPKIWLESEVTDALLLGPAEIKAILTKKKSPKGYVFKKGAPL